MPRIHFVSILVVVMLAGCSAGRDVSPPSPPSGWAHYGGDEGGSRYSAATQIHKGNVGKLKLAWMYRTGEDVKGRYSRYKAFEATPILVDGMLYFATPSNRVIALDAESGRQRWSHDPRVPVSHFSEYTSRGVAAWSDREARPDAPCASRIFAATIDARLIALDGRTGTPCADFGDGGIVDLKTGVGKVEFGDYQVSSAPVVLHDQVIVGSAIGDNRGVELERGVVRAFGARTGVLRWAWDPIPRDPNDPARATWKGDSADRTGAANAWAPLSVDAQRDLVFVPTSCPSPDFYGGERLGDNRYANSVVALRGSTGEVVWYFQVVHHDLWDYDVPAQPVLTTVKRDGKEVPAVVQATKMGHLFVLHRETGQPLFPVEERPVPRTDVPGEETSPAQPFPLLPRPLVPQHLTADDAWGLTPWDRGACREQMAPLRSEGIFTPPSLEGTIVFPGFLGGTNWGSIAVDPARGLALVNSSRLAFLVRLVPRDRFNEDELEKGDSEATPQRGTPYGMVRKVLLSPLGLPCNPPPWGTLAGVDLNSGEVRWEVPLGTVRDLAPVPLPIRWGTPNLGGPLVTASGLIFIGGTMDDYLRAFDVESGEELWKGRLPAGGQATPMTYQLGENGRQYVVIAAGGHGKIGTKLGDYVLAFALPDE